MGGRGLNASCLAASPRQSLDVRPAQWRWYGLLPKFKPMPDHNRISIRKIGVSTGRGDCPGLNAVIRAVVKSAILGHGWSVLGIEDSFEGLIWPEKVRELRWNDVSGILSHGGTILGTTNCRNPL